MSGRPSEGRRLRHLLAQPEIIVAPGAINALSARLIERAGFNAVYMTGAGTALALGMPDVGLVTMSEMLATAASITSAVGIPVIADADTGYGNAINVRRTVQEFERTGVAAVHLEDQVSPKKCGHLRGKRLIAKDEMVQKIRAACDARIDPDFVIIARCDALLVSGLEDAVDRGRAYARAGADVLFVESPRSVEEIQELAGSFDIPLLFNMGSSGRTPFLSAAEVQAFGYKMMLIPTFVTLAAIRAMEEVLAEIRRTGSVVSVRSRCATFEEYMELGGIKEIQELEARYGTPEELLTAI